jgi:site-specific recombinase XerD
MYRYNHENKPAHPAPPRLLDQMRERIRYKHYSLRTEKAYLFWVRRFIRFHDLRHPKSMGSAEIERYLAHLATVKMVSPSTHKQALAAILFLYREVLGIDLPWMGEIGRPRTSQHVPVVLSREEV